MLTPHNGSGKDTLERLYDAIETGKVSLDDVGPRIRALRERYDKLQARKEELNMLVAEETLEVPTVEEIRECAADLRNSLERGSLAERKAFHSQFRKGGQNCGRRSQAYIHTTHVTARLA